MSSLARQLTIRHQLRQAVDRQALTRICGMDEARFHRYGQKVMLEQATRYRWAGKVRYSEKSDRYYYYQDNGSRILGVAHLDSVQGERWCRFGKKGTVVRSPALDDRLGAYVILELLPKLGITVDWLLTVGEETGDSTAKDFATEKVYDWMFSFDRAGTDVVMYDYENQECIELLEDVGAYIGMGSFSDICYLEELGCAGFNWGVGYQDYHSRRAFAPIEDMICNVARFVDFFERNSRTHLEFDPSQRPHYFWDEGNDWENCPSCGEPLQDDYCETCGLDWSWDRKAQSEGPRLAPGFSIATQKVEAEMEARQLSLEQSGQWDKLAIRDIVDRLRSTL